MSKKPRGRRYANLRMRGPNIWLDMILDGQRVRKSTKTTDWDEAAERKEQFLERRRAVASREAKPTFAEMADSYLAGGHGLAETTTDDRTGRLAEGGELRTYFGEYALDRISRGALQEWWDKQVIGRDRSVKTGLNLLGDVSAVFSKAIDLEHIEEAENPVPAFRKRLARGRNTKGARADSDPTRNIKPIEPDRLGDLVEASAEIGGAGHIVTMLCLDAGLRLGEAMALDWEDVYWVAGRLSQRPCLSISRSLARGKHLGTPKSGRSRVVGLSQRLARVLRREWVAEKQPASGSVCRIDPANYRSRHFRRACEVAQVGPRSPKDLRDTFASLLLSQGVPLGYIQRQLGHSSPVVTASHYAKWLGGDEYREPVRLRAGEIPADILARTSEFQAQNGHTELSEVSEA